MLPASIVQFTPYARVATTVLPFLLTIAARIIWGKNRLTRGLFTLSTIWITINLLMAPFSVAMQRDLIQLQAVFRR